MNLYKGKGKTEELGQLMAMLDEVFFGEAKDIFIRLHPKLYKPGYSPCENNFIIKEDGEIKAAIGLFPMTVYAAGRELKVGGIGNVAVTKDCRGKGYMIDCLNRAIEEMKADGTVYSILGGDRQRYGFFGYEPVGMNQKFYVNRNNIEHVLSKDAKSTLKAVRITADDTEVLKKIKELHENAPFYCKRETERFFDILCTWDSVPFAAFEGDEFKGYFVKQSDGKSIREIKPVSADDLLNLTMCAMETAESNEVEFNCPPSETELCDKLIKIACESRITHTEMISIYDYKSFIEAFLALRGESVNLCDGSLVLLIHGDKKDEQLEITVSGGEVRVEDTEKAPDLELGHREAEIFLCALYSKERNSIPAFAQTWFPLHFFSYSLDDV